MEYKYAFENLEVWQIARNLTVSIYKSTTDYPEYEKYGLVNQLRRASISICSNLAEGNARTSALDRAHFFQIAYSSTMEVINQLIISNDLEYVSEIKLNEYREIIEKLSNKINALHKSQLNKNSRSR